MQITFTRLDLIDYFTERRSKSIFASLRRANLGVDTTMFREPFKNRNGVLTSGRTCNYFKFEINETIVHYEKILYDYKNNAFRQPNNCILKDYKTIIKELKNFKKYLSGEDDEKA